ncbi:hypothetical protein KM043_011147 [Ampulex compressa]|nr:hypothetical protein KM043_011147 [Ampulex compressa]
MRAIGRERSQSRRKINPAGAAAIPRSINRGSARTSDRIISTGHRQANKQSSAVANRPWRSPTRKGIPSGVHVRHSAPIHGSATSARPARPKVREDSIPGGKYAVRRVTSAYAIPGENRSGPREGEKFEPPERLLSLPTD